MERRSGKEFIGHTDEQNIFFEKIKNNTLSHAHLIIGSDGIGKSLFAKQVANRYIGKDIFSNSVDVIELRVKDKSTLNPSIGINEIRKIILEVHKKPYEGNKKAIIIYNGDTMTQNAQNAFLKTIEEPEGDTLILILTENEEMVLETIKSRCEITRLRSLNEEEMNRYIDINYEVESKDKKAIIRYSMGIPGKCDKYFLDDQFIEMRKVVFKMIQDYSKNEFNFLEAIKIFEKYSDRKREMLELIENFTRDIIIYKEISNEDFLINFDMKNEIDSMVTNFTFEVLNKIINAVREANINIKLNINKSLSDRVFLIKSFS